MPHLFCPVPLQADTLLDLPEGPVRHIQVLRLQPGQTVRLFDGLPRSGLWGHHHATITQMGRGRIQVQVGAWHAGIQPRRPAVHLAVGVPANERMDWLVEKATELGVASITPLQTARSVLRLSGERAQRRQAHWQAIAVAACEQCGRDDLPTIAPITTLTDWLAATPALTAPNAACRRWVLSLNAGARALEPGSVGSPDLVAIHALIGPEGGLSPDEDTAARAAGCLPVRLGALTLRTETAALALLARCQGPMTLGEPQAHGCPAHEG